MDNFSFVRLATLGLALALASCGVNDGPSGDVEQILEDFYGYDGAEDTLMDPLIVGGKKVVPVLLDEILNTDMQKRRYAIGALGNIGDLRALAVLQEIAENTEEAEYIRCDCVQAIALIDWGAGREIAGRLVEKANTESVDIITGCLPRVSQSVLSSRRDDWLTDSGMARSLEDAKQRRHY